MNKKSKKFLAGFLCVILLLSMAVIPASAGGIIGNEQISTSIMNELSVRAAINSYFSQRLSFLNGETTTIDVINEGMMADETAHKAYLEAEGIVMQSSSVAITEVSCWDDMAVASANETAVFEMNGGVVSETIIHEMTFYSNEQNIILLQSDAYFEDQTGFSSASYLSPEEIAEAEIMLAQNGSGHCVRYVAYNEVGKSDSAEDANGNTKYHDWYKSATGISEYGLDWCAIFVSWCAAHANVSSSVVYYNASVPNMRWFFGNKGQFYVWATEQNKKNNGQEYTSIRAGDIIFMNGTASSPSHIGIVYSTYGDVIWIVDGNWQNRVCYRVVPDSNTAIVGFARPGYASTSHSQSSAWSYDFSSHWHECSNCLGQFQKASHNRTETVAGWSACTVCGYNGPVPEIMDHVIDYDLKD